MEDSNNLFCPSELLWARETEEFLRNVLIIWAAPTKSFASPGIFLLSTSVSTAELVTLKSQTN